MPESADHTPEIEAKKSRGLGSYVGRFVIWVFVAVVVYVLSFGPILRLGRAGVFSASVNRWLESFYEPLVYAYDSTLLHIPLGLYLHVWNPDLVNSSGEPVHPPPTGRK